jgi:hypothetical protein
MIKVRIENIDGIKKKQTYLKNRQDQLNVRLARLAVTIQGLIRAGLNNELGNKANHFDVNVQFTGIGIVVIVKSKDQIGKYLYSGTKAHEISSSSKAMPMPDGNFSYNVTHPGTPSLKPKIDNIVKTSVYAARNMVK